MPSTGVRGPPVAVHVEMPANATVNWIGRTGAVDEQEIRATRS
jgi:hypothetical protein